MRLISHRGNIEGKNVDLENKPEYINEAINNGFEVEIDVWFKDKKWFLGHDNPEYGIDLDWLQNTKKFWIHCKNIDAFSEMYFLFSQDIVDLNFFWQDKDLFSLTSHGYLWGNVGTNLLHNTCKSITVLPEIANDINITKFAGICSDFIKDYKGKF